MQQFQVNKQDLSINRVASGSSETLTNEGISFEVERFAFTANNLTYFMVGEKLGYWQFFPPIDNRADENWGIIPVWGIGKVVASNNSLVEVGSRYFGYFPPATYLHMNSIALAQGNLIDTSAHRKPLPQGYNLYRPLEQTQGGKQAHIENLQMLLWPLYITSYCLWDLIEQSSAKPEQVVVLSASSKTSLGLAHALKKSGYHTIGITSSKNESFVSELNIYSEVLHYDGIEYLSSKQTIVVDMSGNAKVKNELKAKLGGALMRYVQVGLTHWQDAVEDEDGEFFFAPAHIQARIAELGAQTFHTQSGAFIKEAMMWSASWLNVKEQSGIHTLADDFYAICKGDIPANVGLVYTPS